MEIFIRNSITANNIIGKEVARYGFLDESVDNVILDGVHGDGEEKHHKGDLQRSVSFCPSQSPVSDLDNEGKQLYQEKHAYFHDEQTQKVDDGLLEPP